MTFPLKAIKFNRKSKTQKTLVCNTGEAIEIHVWYHPFPAARFFITEKRMKTGRESYSRNRSTFLCCQCLRKKMNFSAIYSHIYGLLWDVWSDGCKSAHLIEKTTQPSTPIITSQAIPKAIFSTLNTNGSVSRLQAFAASLHNGHIQTAK